MKNDSVREELYSSLTPLSSPIKYQFAERAAVRRETVPPPAMKESKPVEKRVDTSDLRSKKTSPTLAEFKNVKATVPDWRLELQNKVRQRTGRGETVDAVAKPAPSMQTSGANALKVHYAEETALDNQADIKVANALKRIEQSRRTYLPSEKAREGIRVARAASKQFPFNVVSRSADAPERPTPPADEPAGASAAAPRPRLVSSMKIEKKKYDTNKLVPIPEAEELDAGIHDTQSDETPETKLPLKENWSQKLEFKADADHEIEDIDDAAEPVEEIEPEADPDEIEDLAPISMRFNAGVFDLIIGGFATGILLSPVMAWSESWFSFSGVLLFIGVMMLVMFVYQTASIAFMGQTFGMKLFSLELVDVEQSDFPTLSQAALNSGAYLLSLIFGGLGFIPLLINEEKRALHDLLSGTILVREV